MDRPDQISEQQRAGFQILQANPDGTKEVTVELATDQEGQLIQNQDGTYRTKDGTSVDLPQNFRLGITSTSSEGSGENGRFW